MCSKNVEERKMHSEKLDEWFSHVPSEEITVEGEGQKKPDGLGQVIKEWDLGYSFCWEKNKNSRVLISR